MSSGDLKTLRDNVSVWSSSKDNFDFGPSPAAAHSTGSKTTHSSIGPHPEAARVIGPSRDPRGDSRQVIQFSVLHCVTLCYTVQYGADQGGGSFEREERREAERAHFKRERKELRKQQELVWMCYLRQVAGCERHCPV